MGNLVIVSNRLPVSVKKEAGKLVMRPSVGGLATGLSNYTTKRGTKWVGWPGLASDDLTETEKRQIVRELKKHRCYPVFLTQKQIDLFYSGYSNGLLWPVFHDLPHATHPESEWRAYREVNQLFASEALNLSKAGSTIWVHDYQLALVPQYIREAARDDRVGFFLHIPFPASEFHKLKTAKNILRGILGSDLVGFHTKTYTGNFLESCEKILGLPSSQGRLLVGKRLVQVAEFPMGIDYARFEAAAKQRSLRRQARALRRKYHGQRIIVSVDRLDITKGLVERIQAYHQLLKNYPSLAGKIVMVMVVSPSRTDVPEYRQLKKRIDQALDVLQKDFGTARWKPVEFRYETVPLDEVMAYYHMADIAFITPIIDGMNLVAKEFLATKQSGDGVLILSETAGAAEELREAVLVNPRKPHTMVRGLVEALNMPPRELKRRVKLMNEQLKEFSVQRWADNFMDTLQKPYTVALPGVHPITRSLKGTALQRLAEEYRTAKKRLLLLDYDGVLHRFEKNPDAATPPPKLQQTLKRLTGDPRNEVVIISGRSKNQLQAWFGHLTVALAAEHGAVFRRKGGTHWHKAAGLSADWKSAVLPVLETYAALTPGALIEEKEWAIVWHYRAASPYFAQKSLVALRRLLRPVAKRDGLIIEEGNKVFELHPSIFSKGRVAEEWLIHDHDFVLCIGDDTTDEDMFAVLSPEAYSIKVGRGTTKARFRLKGVSEVLNLLGKL